MPVREDQVALDQGREEKLLRSKYHPNNVHPPTVTALNQLSVKGIKRSEQNIER